MRLLKDVPKYERERSKFLAGALEKSEAEIKQIQEDEDAHSLAEEELHRGYYSVQPDEYTPATCTPS